MKKLQQYHSRILCSARRSKLPGALALRVIGVILILGSSVGGLTSGAFAQPDLADSPFVEGELLVRYRAGAWDSIEETHRRLGLEVIRHNQDLDIYLLRGEPKSRVADLVANLQTDPAVEFAYLGEGGLVPNDTSFAQQWHHLNTGQSGGSKDADIDSVEGWDLTTGSASTVVAVLDTGLDSDHPEFAGRTVSGFDFVNGDNDPEDDQSHGTFVTGLLAANANNGFSVAGVDHQVMVMPVKVLNQNNGGTTADLIDGLTFAANQGADVISMSLINYPGTSSLQLALQFARNSGAVLIACAGNGGRGNADVSWPGASPSTISVGATDQNDGRAFFSGTGAALHVVAPGLNVATVRYNDSTNGSASFSGCSAATPIVAGVTTLLHGLDPDLTHEQARQILTTTAEDQVGPPGEDTPGRDDNFGHGRINLHDAIANLLGGGCVPPASGDWIVNASCTFQGTAIAAGHVVIDNGAILTLAAGSSLGLDFNNFHLLVRRGSRVIVQSGAIID